ncbi:hypothetical protein BY78_08285 [Escherichia coli O157:H7 str. K4406]|nr:hypothetical protein BY78_08285 [Escherichia coli O157:H7 str. K4406]
MIWQPEFTDKTLSRKPGAVHIPALTCSIVVIPFSRKARTHWRRISFSSFWSRLARLAGKVASNCLNTPLMICATCCTCGFSSYCSGMLLAIRRICSQSKLTICAAMFFINPPHKSSQCLSGPVLIFRLSLQPVACYG